MEYLDIYMLADARNVQIVDENLEAKDVKDDRVIMRLLGNRMVY